MLRRITRKRLLVALTAIAAFAIAGAALAFFTDSGTGTGSGTVGSSAHWGVSTSTTGGFGYVAATDTAAGTPGVLEPGVSAADQTVHVTIKNNGHGNQELHSFTISVGTTNSDGTEGTYDSGTTAFPSEDSCTASDFALGTNTADGSYTVDSGVDSNLPDDLAPGATYQTTVNLHMLDLTHAQDNCQGQTVPLYISAS
jgi:hypothetical protein